MQTQHRRERTGKCNMFDTCLSHNKTFRVFCQLWKTCENVLIIALLIINCLFKVKLKVTIENSLLLMSWNLLSQSRSSSIKLNIYRWNKTSSNNDRPTVESMVEHTMNSCDSSWFNYAKIFENMFCNNVSTTAYQQLEWDKSVGRNNIYAPIMITPDKDGQ